MCFGVDQLCVDLLLKRGIFNSSTVGEFEGLVDKMYYVLKYEVRMSVELENAGYDIKPFQLSGLGLDTHGDINYEGKYFGITLNPLEVMFIKTVRINDDVVGNYTKWLCGGER